MSAVGSAPPRPVRPLERLALWSLTTGFFAFYVRLGLQRLHGFAPRSIDLAFYEQLVWCLAHRMAPVTLAGGVGPLSLHVMPVLAPLCVLSRWISAGDLLVVAHVAALALVLPAAHRLGGWFGVALCALCPALTTQANFDVHPDVWAFAPMLLAVALEREGRERAALVAWIAAFACRESIPLLALAYALCRYGERPAHYRRLALVAVAWGVGALAVFALAGGGPSASIDAHVGHGGVLARVFSLRVAVALITWAAASGALAPLRPRVAAAALLVFALNATSAVPTTLDLGSHYAALAFPFLLAAATLAPERFVGRRRTVLRAIALVAVAAAYVFAGDGPGALRFRFDERPAPARRARYQAALDEIPRDASVAASLPLAPALALRARVYRDTDTQTRVDDVVLVTSDPRSSAALYRVRGARWLAEDPALGVASARPGVVRLARGADRRTALLAAGGLDASPRTAARVADASGECLRFSTPIATAPPAGASIEVRTPAGEVAPASAGRGLWLPGLGGPSDTVPVSLCGPREHLGAGTYAWRWVVSDAAARPVTTGAWSALEAP